jgi:transcriptional regulator with XRE-family HTH domain
MDGTASATSILADCQTRLRDMPEKLNLKQIAAVRRLRLTEKWPLRQIARHLRISRETIKKYLFSPDRPTSPPRQYASKLDSYKPAIAGLLQRDFTVKSKAIFQHLRSLGYQGGSTILRAMCEEFARSHQGHRFPEAGKRSLIGCGRYCKERYVSRT